MNTLVKKMMDKAMKSIKGAEVLLSENLNDFAVSRSYYAMFYLAEALLCSKGLSFSSHRAVISAFAREFIKLEIIDKKYHEYITDAFSKRQIGDYGISENISRNEAQKLIKRAKEFLKIVSEYLGKENIL
ncbi:MAG: HEPN domain-containing protein [Planctomycetota bacterium]